MFHWLYNTGIAVFGAGVRVAAALNPKAELFVKGRKRVWDTLNQWSAKGPENTRLYWFHCASLGEFEQGRPVIEALRHAEPGVRIVLTFFSPSGYEVRKQYAGADLVMYLPLDTPSQARRFVQVLKPDAALFVKYEYWANYFFALKNAGIPLLVVSGIFRRDQRFFGWQRSFWKKVLGCVDHFFLQTEQSAELLESLGFSNFSVSGDTRFDRVLSIAASAVIPPKAVAFCRDFPVVIAGSSYPAEEEALIALWQKRNGSERLVLVPHEVDDRNIRRLADQCGEEAVLWSRYDGGETPARILIVDEIGHLSTLYLSAHIAVIGGGYGKGIHNTLEAAVYGIPLVFGPNWGKFDEASGLISVGGAVSAASPRDMAHQVGEWLDSEGHRKQAGEKAGQYVRDHAGALDIVLRYLEKMR